MTELSPWRSGNTITDTNNDALIRRHHPRDDMRFERREFEGLPLPVGPPGPPVA
jgi:hypothetical protein